MAGELKPYLFRNKDNQYVIAAASPKAAVDYNKQRRFSGHYIGLDTRSDKERWDSQILCHVDDEEARP